MAPTRDARIWPVSASAGLGDSNAAAAAVDGDLVGDVELASADGMLTLPPSAPVEMSYLVSPGGRITLILPPWAVIRRLRGTWLNARVTSPPPDAMVTCCELTALALTLPPSVENWRLPVIAVGRSEE